jgi:hypothetical protein
MLAEIKIGGKKKRAVTLLYPIIFSRVLFTTRQNTKNGLMRFFFFQLTLQAPSPSTKTIFLIVIQDHVHRQADEKNGLCITL